MPMKDLDKLTVVKLRAELIARGLDPKGNKPFLVDRLRIALEEEEQHGVDRPEIKMLSEQIGDTSMDPEIDDEQIGVQSGETEADESFASNPNQVGNGSNGTPEVSSDVLNNGNHTSSAEKPEKTEEMPTEAVPELPSIEKPKQIPSVETSTLKDEIVKQESCEDADNSTSSALNDSVMAVYGGKDETFMENSTLEQSVDMSSDQAHDNLACNLTTNSSTLDVKDSSLTSQDTIENASLCNKEKDVSAQDTPTEEVEKDSDVVLPQDGDVKEENKMEVADATLTTSGDGEEKTDVPSQESEVQASVSPTKDGTSGDKTDRGSKRQRDRSSSPANVNKVAEGPPPEDEPEFDASLVLLDWYNSDLNLIISKTDFVSAAPLTESGFAYMWAGARATYGFEKGKICFEVKVVENLPVTHLEESEPNHHVVRIGWSVDSTTYQLGEDPFSYGYGGTAKISQNCEFKDYGVPFQLNDVVGAYLDASDDKDTVEISFTVNGEAQGVAFTLTKEELNSRALFPHISTKNCRFEVNFGQKEEPWYSPIEGYEWASKVPVESRVRGAVTPATRADCQMIMMCGLPGAGKTTWANTFSSANPDQKFNILGTNAFLDKMKVNGLPRRKNYSGRWEVLIEKCTRCLNILLEIAAKRRRNYILDQTNVYPTAQKRKMSFFTGFKRKAVVIVPSEEEAKVRVEKRIQEEGKDVPDSAVMEMKANFKIPSVDDTFAEVEFPELSLEEALKVTEKYSTEAKAAGYGQPSPKRQRQQQGNRNKNDRNDNRRSNHSGRDRNRDSRGSNSHRSSSSRSYRDSRDDRHRPPPPSHWRGGGGGPGRGGGWSNRGPPPPPLSRNGPYSPRRGPPLPPLPPVNRGGWNAPLPERPYPGARSSGGGGGGGGGRGYDDRRNDRPYSSQRREGGPSPWMGSPSMGGAAPQRSSWGHSQSWNSGSGSSSASSAYGQPQQSGSYGAGSAYGGSALYGSAGAARPSGGYGTTSVAARPTSGSNYGSSSTAAARPVAAPYGGAGITGLARPANYGSNGPARPASYGPTSLPGNRPASYGSSSGSGSARPTNYSSASINPWSQQPQQPQQTGYQYPYNPNHSTYSGGK